MSLRSGGAVLGALQKQGVDAFGVDLGDRGVEQFLSASFDLAFIALHGRGGDDGCVQGILEWLGIPYTGSGVLASAIATNKYRTKQVWASLGLNTPPSRLVCSIAELEAVLPSQSFPLMVKAAQEGSSIGVYRADTAEELRDAYRKAARKF